MISLHYLMTRTTFTTSWPAGARGGCGLASTVGRRLPGRLKVKSRAPRAWVDHQAGRGSAKPGRGGAVRGAAWAWGRGDRGSTAQRGRRSARAGIEVSRRSDQRASWPIVGERRGQAATRQVVLSL